MESVCSVATMQRHSTAPHAQPLGAWRRGCASNQPPMLRDKQLHKHSATHINYASIKVSNARRLSAPERRGIGVNSEQGITEETTCLFPQREQKQWRPADEKYLQCCWPGGVKRPLKIAVLVSGGVDSSVSLRLLLAAGHHCTAFYLKIDQDYVYENYMPGCPWEDDLKYVRSVCEQAGVDLQRIDFTDRYWKSVVSYMISEYKRGFTPNPDILCNTRIKFGEFLDYIDTMNFDYIASGHYARVQHSGTTSKDTSAILCLSLDNVKDQTYFLSHLSQKQLKKLIFPLGCIPKNEVRELAADMGLPNKDRKDSQGICFLGKVKFSEFVARHIGEMEGILLEAETGAFLGNHRGFWFYTIGQRQGLGLTGGPWYVVAKDVENNVIFVSRNYYSLEMKRLFFHVSNIRWIYATPEDFENIKCKVRHGPGFYDCKIEHAKDIYWKEHNLPHPVEDSTQEVYTVTLSENDQGLAAGQFAAFYKDNICLGSGIIVGSSKDAYFPVCSKALEIAKIKDKSVLGKPIKIGTPVKSTETKNKFPAERAVKGSKEMKPIHMKKGGSLKKESLVTQLLMLVKNLYNPLSSLLASLRTKDHEK